MAARFWSKVDKQDGEGCWLWQGGKRYGYGVFGVGSRHEHRIWSAPRFAAMLAGITVPVGKVLCHRCDTPACVRPDHLFVGSQRDNLMDAHAKGRHVATSGKRYRHHKLTADGVREIRLKASQGVPNVVLAREYGVSSAHISAVVRGRFWAATVQWA